MEIKVLTTGNKIKTLILDHESFEHLRNEVEGMNRDVWEYKTDRGEIITDLEIKNIY